MTTVPLSDAKARLSEIADEVDLTHDRVLAAEQVGGGLATLDDRLAAAARARGVAVRERGGSVGGGG
jgi:hypothetical protein